MNKDEEYGVIEKYGFNLFRWIKGKFQRREGWGSVCVDITGLDESEEEM